MTNPYLQTVPAAWARAGGGAWGRAWGGSALRLGREGIEFALSLGSSIAAASRRCPVLGPSSEPSARHTSAGDGQVQSHIPAFPPPM